MVAVIEGVTMLSTLDTISIGRPITTLLAVYWPELLAGLSVVGELPDGRPPRLEVALMFVRRLRHADRLVVDGVGLGRETRFTEARLPHLVGTPWPRIWPVTCDYAADLSKRVCPRALRLSRGLLGQLRRVEVGDAGGSGSPQAPRASISSPTTASRTCTRSH